MQLDPAMFGLILLCALVQAVWNTLMKLGQDQLVINALIAGVAMLMAAFLLPFEPAPPPGTWPYIGASTVLQTVFYIFRGESFRFGDINRVVPLMRGTGLVAVAIAAAVFAGEPLSLRQIGGLAGILVGMLGLSVFGGRSLWDGWLSVLLAIVTGFAIGGYTFIDGLGVRHADSQLGYLVWVTLISGIPIIILAALWRRASLVNALKRNWVVGGISGVLGTAVYCVIVWAFSIGAFAPVMALRETSILFTALSGSIFLHEAFGRRRIVAACLIVAGILALNL
jgi:drug/metabolite transporter (DMT)-like permease